MSGFGTAIGFAASFWLFRDYSTNSLTLNGKVYKYRSYAILKSKLVPSLVGSSDYDSNAAWQEYWSELRS